jgi:Asp-tRNA(Asn)/Glu-tRNA(Gln) amidotransferase A subunit family amidase
VSGFAEYEHYDALALADLVRRRRVSAGELLEAAIARVEARNPAINAVTMPLYDDGRAAIAAGLPIATQLVARYGDEATLFRLAAQLEAARPWFDRKPALAS